jgi:DegV family protein with EDD domain
VTIVDSESVSYALGFQAIRAAELAATGGSADEIAATITAERARYHIIFFVETLEHLRRGGRIGKAAQLVGTMLKLKPLLRVDGGQVVPFERTRTRSRAIATLLDFARELNGVEQAAVIYNSTPEEAASLAERVRQISTSDSIPVVQFGPVISTHVGPGVLGLVLKEQKRG